MGQHLDKNVTKKLLRLHLIRSPGVRPNQVPGDVPVAHVRVARGVALDGRDQGIEHVFPEATWETREIRPMIPICSQVLACAENCA